MLGKGLESLIPPKKNDAASAVSAAQSAGGTGSGAPAQDSAHHDQSGTASTPVAPPPGAPGTAPSRPTPLRKPERGGESIFHIEVTKISPNPFQPRRHFDEAALGDLAASIRDFGFLQPLVVTKKEVETPTGLDVTYELIAGERRLLAAQRLGLERVPAIVRTVHEDEDRLQMAIIENIQRENLNPVEVARAFARLQDEFRLTQREIAGRLGKSREVVANALRLLDLPMSVQNALEHGEISESHGRLLLAVSDPGAREKLFRDLLERRLSTRELKQRVEQYRERKQAPSAAVSPELAMLQERLSAELGTPVVISQSGTAGKITINFYSDEELRTIMQKLGKEGEEDVVR